VEAAFVGFTRPAAQAFTRHGVKHVVAVTALVAMINLVALVLLIR
jgi:hypothetical protein